MVRYLAWILAAGLAFTPTVALAAACEPPSTQAAERSQQRDSKSDEHRRRFVKWWQEPAHRAELGITDEQSAMIEAIFQAHLPEQRQRYRQLERLQPALAKLIKEGTAEPAIVAREVEKVEDLTAEVRKARIITLYRMHRELTREQRMKLKAMDDRDHRRGSTEGRRQ